MPDRIRCLRVGTLLFSALLALAACGSAPAPTKLAPTRTPTVTRTKAPTATPTATPTPEPPKSRNPGTLIYLTKQEPDTLDPHVDFTSAGAGVFQNVYETLVTYDKTDPNRIVPLVAEFIPEAVAVPEGVTYTFVIPRGISFHDGHEVTPEDVAYSLWRSMLLGHFTSADWLPESGAPGYLLLEALLGVNDAALLVDAGGKFVADPEFLRMAKADVLRDACERVKAAVTFDNRGRSVTLKLPRPYAPLLPTLAGPWASIISRQWMTEQGEWDGDCQTWQYFYGVAPTDGLIYARANGTGPYQLDHWTPGAEIILTANPAYRQGAPKINQIAIKTIGNFEQRVQLLQAGDADLIAAAGPEEQARLDKLLWEKCDPAGHCKHIDFTGRLRVYDGLPATARRNVFFNFALPADSPYAGSGQLDGQGVPLDFFNDAHVRRAFDACFDRAQFITATLAGRGETPLAITLPDQPGYAGSPTADFDLARCAAEFKAAEFRTQDDLTLWDVGFTLQLPYRDGDTLYQAVVENLAQNLAQVNATFVITPLALSADDWQRELRAGKIPLAAVGWQEDIHDPHNWYQPYFLETALNYFNLPADQAARYRDFIAAGAAELDPDARAAAYAALNQALHDDAAVLLIPSALGRRYEPVYLKGWLAGLNRNLLLPEPGNVAEYSKH
jgi:peptide/nickel transport system substrate-binding protein